MTPKPAPVVDLDATAQHPAVPVVQDTTHIFYNKGVLCEHSELKGKLPVRWPRNHRFILWADLRSDNMPRVDCAICAERAKVIAHAEKELRKLSNNAA